MKRYFLLVALVAISATMNAAKLRIDRIDPTDWFVGLKNSQVQLMVYGKDIATVKSVSTDYPGAVVDSVVRLDSPNYLLVYMNLRDAQPGTMSLSFDKLKVSLRKVQVRELEKQMAVYQRAKNLDVSKFSEEATADFQRRFKEYTVKRYWGGGYQKDKDFSLWVVGELKKGQVNPNVEVVDSSYKAYSGPLLSCIFSGRIELAAEIAHELLKLGANSDVRFSEIDRLITSVEDTLFNDKNRQIGKPLTKRKE